MSLTADELRQVDEYLASWWDAVRAKVETPMPPVALMQKAALEHPNGRIKRHALGLLDHHANDESTETFRLALGDPSARVRMGALHGLSCDRCRVGELCTDDVVPTLIAVLEHDENPNVRAMSLYPLVALAGRDERIAAAFARVAANDPDELVRASAAAARDGNYRGVKSRKALRRRREAKVGVGSFGE